ncbi:MAG: hypothetical protein Q9214_002524 [Letrouitia sp. 1 TL-2023]
MPTTRAKSSRDGVIQAVSALRDQLNGFENEALAQQQVGLFLDFWVTNEHRVQFLEEWLRLNKGKFTSRAHINGQGVGHEGRDGNEERTRSRREMRSRGGRERPILDKEIPIRGEREMPNRGGKEEPIRGGKEKPNRGGRQPRQPGRQNPPGRRGGRPRNQQQEPVARQANQVDEDGETEDEGQEEEDDEAEELSGNRSPDQEEEEEADEHDEEQQSEAQEDGLLENGQSLDGEAEDEVLENGQSSDGQTEDGVLGNGRSLEGEAEDSGGITVEHRINQPQMHPGLRDQGDQLDQQQPGRGRANELNRLRQLELGNRETLHNAQTVDPQANRQGQPADNLPRNLQTGDNLYHPNTPVRPLAITDILRQDQHFTTPPDSAEPRRAEIPTQSNTQISIPQQQSLLSPPETQRRQEDARRMQPLLDAAFVPNFNFKEPLRLTSIFIDGPTLENIKNKIVEASGFETFPKNKRQALVAFVGSFYDPAAYWDLRETACSVIQSGGYRVLEREGNTDNKPNREDHRGGFSTTDGFQAPTCLKNFVETWRKRLIFAQETATASIRNTALISHEMHCHIYWQRLIEVWRSDAPYTARVEKGTSDGIDPIRPEECDALQSFIKKELDRRASEFDRKKADEMVHFRTKTILKAIIAPFLGFPVPLGLMLDRKNANSISDTGAMETSMLYNKLWDNTMRRGHVAHVLFKSLGWGALAITRKSHYAALGTETLSRILPVLKRSHPTLRDLLDTVYRVFLFPLQSGQQLLMSNVDRFIRLPDIKTMIAICRQDPQGLKGLFESHVVIPLSLSPGRSPGPGGSGGIGSTTSTPIAPKEPELDYDPDGDGIKSDGEIFTLEQLLSKRPVDGDGLGSEDDTREGREPQEDTSPTPLSSSRGTKRRHATGPNTSSKRLR